MGQLDAPASEKGICSNEEGVGPLARKVCEGRIDLAAGAGVEDLDLQPHGARRRLQSLDVVSSLDVRIDEHSHATSSAPVRAAVPAALPSTRAEEIDPCQVAAWPGEAGDKTKPDRVFGRHEDDGDRRGCRLGRKRRCSPAATITATCRRTNSAASAGSRSFGSRPSGIRSRHSRPRHSRSPSDLGEMRADDPHNVRRSGCEKPDHRHRRLLRTRRKRPRAAAPPSSVMNSRRCSGRDVRFMARPPPRSVRAAFPHTAPASGV